MTILENIVGQKKKELTLLELGVDLGLPRRSFSAVLRGKGMFSLIAEIKHHSPSEKEIFRGLDFNPAQIARVYEEAGAVAISVLTDKKFFGGDMAYLSAVKRATKNAPILAKDFFISEKQIIAAKNAGADAVLLIARILSLEELRDLLAVVKAQEIEALVEVASEADLAKALAADAAIIGINNRDLADFTIDLGRTFLLSRKIPRDKILVAMSGISSAQARIFLRTADAVLIGTGIMRSNDMKAKIQEILHPRSFLKVCGVRTSAVARFCESLGVDFCGLNFVPTSKRSITLEQGRALRKELKKALAVGVFQDQDLDYVNAVARELKLDFVQLHGAETAEYCAKVERPVIRAISLESEADLAKIDEFAAVSALFLFDSGKGGSGKRFDYSLIDKVTRGRVTLTNSLGKVAYERATLTKGGGNDAIKPFFVAGGVNASNAEAIIAKIHPMGLDTASGVEEEGEISCDKIEELFGVIAHHQQTINQ